MTIIDLAILAPCALGCVAGLTLIIGAACDAACDWIDRRDWL